MSRQSTPVLRTLAGLGLATLLICTVGCGSNRVEGSEAGDCSDGNDNDKDGTVDCDDSGCASAPECKTAPAPEATPEATPEADPEATPEVDGGTGEDGAGEENSGGTKPTAAGSGEKPTATKAVDKPTATKAVDKPKAVKAGQ
jgi:hypothetical protein